MSAPTDLRCTVCGRTAASADRFCGFCGARLDGESQTPAPDSSAPGPHGDRILTALRAATIGEYDIAGEIGRGGMAVVFLAHDLSLNRKVAIKALLPELLYTEGMDRRFKHEARIAAKLDHPNILVIHSVREANDLLYIVMKLVEGLPLSSIVKVDGPLSIPVVRLIVRNVADALAYAHGEGVVHRDVKPANIMIDRRGGVIVMDFGIAKAADDAHLTRTGLVIGTPAYMSPEQCLAQPVTSASDQYSLGVVAYELLTGRTPFRGSALEMQWAHATAPPPAVRALRPDCPPDMETVILRMMAKTASDRFPSLHDVSLALTDDPATMNSARATLVSLVDELPGRRDPNLPTTPASPVPIGPGPAEVGDATTDPVRGRTTTAPASDTSTASPPNEDTVSAPLLTLSRPRVELAAGGSVELVVEFAPNDVSVDRSRLEWTSSNSAVATVSQDGIVTAIAPGLADVTCVWENRRAVCQVHVSAAPAVAPVLEPTPTPLPTHPARAAWPRRHYRWTVVAAAAVLGLVIYRATRPDEFVKPLPTDIATSPATPAAPTPPPEAPLAERRRDNPPSPPVGTSAAPAARATESPRTDSAASRRLTANAAAKRDSGPPTPSRPPSAQPTPTASGASSVAIPTVPPPRVGAQRLTSIRDSTTAASSSTAARTSGYPTPAGSTTAAPAPATRDSASGAIAAAPPEISAALFREFANAITARSFGRLTAAFPQPSDQAAAKVWADFLVFVRDYTPRALVRSTSVNASANPPTISGVIEFRWSSDAGYDRTRAATFTGYAIPITGGWQLRGVAMDKRFW